MRRTVVVAFVVIAGIVGIVLGQFIQLPVFGTATTDVGTVVLPAGPVTGTVQLHASNKGDTTRPGSLYACDVAGGYEPVFVGFNRTTEVYTLRISTDSVHDRSITDEGNNNQTSFVLKFDGNSGGFFPQAVIVDMLHSPGTGQYDQHVLPLSLDDVRAGTFTINTEALDPDAFVSEVFICA